MQIHHRRRIVVVLVLSLLGLGGLAAQPASAAPQFGLFIDSEPGDPVGEGSTHTFADDDAVFTSAPLVKKNAIELTVDSPIGCLPGDCTTWTIKMQTPATEFADNTVYDEAVQYNGTTPPATPGLDVATTETNCSSVAGRFIVDEVEIVGDVITAFAARFEQHCNADTPALFGSVSFNGATATPYYTRSVSTNLLDFGSVKQDTSVTKTITVTKGTGSAPTLADIAVTPAGGPFSVVSHDCAAAVASTCDINVKFTPTENGAENAILNFRDELAPAAAAPGTATTGTGRDIALTGSGFHTEVTVTGSALFGNARVGVTTAPKTLVFSNTGSGPVAISDFGIEGFNPSSFSVTTDCGPTLDPTKSCKFFVSAYPTAAGSRAAILHIDHDATTGPHDIVLQVTGTIGYFLARSNGAVVPFGDAKHKGDLSAGKLVSPIFGMTTTITGEGYWLTAADGGVFALGDAKFYGSMGGKPLNKPIVGMAAAPNGTGYWLVASDGGIFAFGPGAAFYGSMGGKPLNKPIVAMAVAPGGTGYWLVASDGGIFAFGPGAKFHGSMGGTPLNQPIVGMSTVPDGTGYWMVALDGGMFAFGPGAKFYGSMGGKPLPAPMIAIAPSPTGLGYWLLGTDGNVYPFGDARDLGDLGSSSLSDVVAMASTAPPVDPARSDGPNAALLGLPRSG